MLPDAHKILVIDDEIGEPRSAERKRFVEAYGSIGFEFAYCDARDDQGQFSVEIVLDFVRENLDASLILLDIMFGSRDLFGVKILESIKRSFDYIPVIMLTAMSEPEVRDRCLRIAKTYLVKDTFSADELWDEVTLYAIPARHRIVGRSAVTQQIRRTIAGYADSPAPVLVTGESGTGKELVAQGVHSLSSRRKEPFVALNMAAIPEGSKESELFGHVRGAFTGAVKDKVGMVELADGGTLFLDEVQSMGLPLQETLLRFAEGGVFRRLGGTKERTANVRIVAATSEDLQALVNNGGFSKALYYRLNVLAVSLPPLRERKDDVPDLVDYWLEFLHYRDYRSDVRFSISPDALECLRNYSWPGNVRELINALQHAVNQCYKIEHAETIEQRHLRAEVLRKRGLSPSAEKPTQALIELPSDPTEWAKYRSMLEIEFMSQAYARTGNNGRQTIQALFPNVDAPSETYVQRYLHSIVDKVWGNANILVDEDLRRAFEPLYQRYIKGRKSAASSRARAALAKLAGKHKAALQDMGAPVSQLKDAFSKAEWNVVMKLATQTAERVAARPLQSTEATQIAEACQKLAEACQILDDSPIDPGPG